MTKNPFVETLVVGYVRWIKRDVPLSKTELEPGDYYDVESERCTRIYRNKERLKDLFEMKFGATRLYLWIVYHISDDATAIRLDDKTLAQEFDCSERSIERMRMELTRAAVIARKHQNEFWINPRFFASNSRLILYPQCTVKVATYREKH